jgi:methylenetetrahydrofolate reductase (NADPH)
MSNPNPLREKLKSGQFLHMVELVASKRTPPEKLLEISSQLAAMDSVVAAGITSYAGGAAGQDPVETAVGAKARGLTPNVHLTCVYQDRKGIRETLEKLHSLDIHNVFAINGDYPQNKEDGPVFDLDSVSLVSMINEMRGQGMPFSISVAVSPFKYTEPDCMYQYIKLEKKFAAGADFAITQLGYDARKFRELKQYLAERKIQKPVIGNVYVLTKGAAGVMSGGRPPGCWVAPELLERITEEAGAEDKGKAARLERAARMVAILRGLGYAGAYIGGTHNAEQIKWVIKRGEEIAPNWEEYAEELNYAPKNAFYLNQSPLAPAKPLGIVPNMLNLAGKMFPVRNETVWRKLLRGMFRVVDKIPLGSSTVETLEKAMKVPMFGCESCGNCVLGNMEYVCPQTCPKQIRNGPCGGTDNGMCEVIPEQECIWVGVYERAKTSGQVEDLKVYIPPPDRSLKGTSSYVNYFLDRDVRPEKEHSK